MLLRLTLAFAVIASLAACGTRLNPFNWFGGDREERIEITEAEVVTDPRGLVAQVLSLSVEAVPQGAIVRATGLPPTQGFWDGELVLTERSESGLVYEFRVFPPPGQTRISTQQSREVVVATSLNMFELSGVRTITVLAQQNRRTVNRR